MRNIKLVLEYDGSDFFGWQYQPRLRTVQGEIEKAFQSLTQKEVKIMAAGRTDTGVHALGQVANFQTESALPVETFYNGGNALLPDDIRILSAEEVPESFNARFSAIARHYKYVLCTKPTAIGRRFCWQVKKTIDVSPMQQACQFLIGEKDFTSFCQAGAELDNFLCDVSYARFTHTGEQIVFEIGANRFLHNMVRILIGTLLSIGKGKQQPQELKDILDAKDRRIAGRTAPAHGLFLARVDY
jgi:tRNA pseudouridine38-40 synthase